MYMFMLYMYIVLFLYTYVKISRYFESKCKIGFISYLSVNVFWMHKRNVFETILWNTYIMFWLRSKKITFYYTLLHKIRAACI